MTATPNPWNDYATEYWNEVQRRGPLVADDNGMAARMLDLLGDLTGKTVLDAGCGEGLLSRLFASRGATVTGVDLSPRLLEMARMQDPTGAIDYRVGDLGEPHPELAGRFEAIGSYLVLNDVADHRGFARSLSASAKPDAPVVLAFNNPYSSIVREHIIDYFDMEERGTYLGMGERGIHAQYYHRTLEEYLDAFISTGLRLERLVDVKPGITHRVLPEGATFPNFMILAFRKPGQPA
ncbi:MAG TPA: methyltransferase domain-containing protein [Thermomicrobiales bacterium]|nr:methyltransferase domain-containing protein [Thermomicrobiales bacterium]